MAWEYEGLFDAVPETDGKDLLAAYWRTEATATRIGSMGYRTRTIKAGTRLEAEVHPIFGRSMEAAARKAKLNMTKERQQQLNTKRAKRRLVLLMEENFNLFEDDAVTLTYAEEPESLKRCKKDVRNFLNRVKRLREKLKMPEMKYIYSIGYDQDHRIHVHCVMTGGIGQKKLVKIWGKGIVNSYLLQSFGKGLQGMANYLYRQNEKARDKGERFYTNLLLDAAENNQISEEQTEQAIDDAAMVRLYAYAGFMNNELPQTSLNRELANSIWQQSVEEHGSNRKGQVAGANRQEAGRATFDGVEYGTEEYNRKIAGLKLSKQTQEWMDTVAGIAQRAGIRADFTIADDDMTYGWEGPEGIGLNISGMNYELDRNGKPKQTGQKHHLLVTFGHEMTHWLQRNSMQGYNRLEQYVLKSYINDHSAEELMMQLNNKMHRGEMLSLEDAISEFVANSCDQILGSEQVRDHIAQTDGKLFSQIKGFVKDLVNRFKNAIKGMDASASYEAQQMAGRMNELAKVWLGAYDDVLSGIAEQKTGTRTEEKTRNSKYGMDKETLRDIYISNFAPNTPNAIKAQRIIDMIQDVWSKKPITLKVYDNNSNGRYIQAEFDPDYDPTNARKTDAGKMAFGNRQGTRTERRVTMNLADDYQDILQNSKYYTFELERKNHKGVKRWFYFTNDIYYVEQGSDEAVPYRIEIDVKEKEDGNFVYTYFAREDTTAQRKKLSVMDLVPVNTGVMSGESAQLSDKSIADNNQNGKTRSSRYISPNENEGFSAESMVDDIDNMETEGNPSRNIIEDTSDIVKLDREYADAVARGDLQTATDMLMEKLRKTEGVIPVMAPNWDTGEYRETAKQLKTGDPEAIEKAATEMAKHVPENAVLIPMPGREGKLTNDSWTVKLANAISEKTGRPVVIALEGVERESRQEAKGRGEQGASQEELGFRQVAEIPEGTFPIFIDNVVGKGVTADAARQAMGGGITLAYTKTLRSPGIQGLKNAVVTYESESKGGGLIPLSKRFDVSKRDVRYSKANVEQITPELMAVHNLTYYDLMRTLKEGGFTAPSIAIIKSAMGHDKYGEISVLFKKNAFDPQADRRNKIYGADAYTPTRENAHVETELNMEQLNKTADEIAETVKDMEDDHVYNEIQRWFSERNYREVTTQNAREMAEEAYSNDAFLTAYLKAEGKEIPIKTKEKYANPSIKQERLEGYERIFNALYDSGVFDEFWKDVENGASGETLMEKYADIAASAEPEMKKMLDLYREKGGKLPRNAAYNWIKQTIDWLRGGSEKVTETDWYETRKAMWDMVDKNKFIDWLAEKIEPAFGRKGIRNNMDPFTYSGNRRSWNQLHIPYTIENVVRAMYENADEKGQGGRYATGVVAAASKEYKSLEEVRADKERLKLESQEDYEKIIADLNERLNDLAREIWPTSHNVFDYALMEVAKKYAKNQTDAAIRSGFREEDISVTQKQVEKVKAFLEDARNIPTGYFEAKPQRVMNFDEIDTVILPSNTYEELLDLLDKNNIHYEFYDGTSADRTEKLNSHKDLKFSRWTEDAMDVSSWMAGATASTVQTEDERILLDAFRGMRIKMSLSLKKQMDYKAKIRQMEGKANLTTEQKSELTALRNRLEIEQNKYARLEDEMFKVTNADGWAGMMYRENMLLKDYIQGKTQDQVRQTVEDMLKMVKQTQDQIEKDTAELKKLAEAQAVKTMKSFMGKTSLGRAAATLRKTYNSTMAKAEIEDRLAEIALKQASGKDITSDTEMLAQDLLDKMRGIRSDALESLRGVTFVIGQSLADELKAENSSIKELQSRLKGSGVKLVTGQKSSTGEIDKHSRISEQWSELREKDQSLPDVDGMAEIDKLHTIVDFIEGELRASTGAEQFNIDFDEVAAMVRAQASMVTTYLVDDPKARAQITNLMQQIAELSKKTEKTATDMERLYQQMDDVVLAGQKAKGWTTILQRDVNEAIRYYNKTAKVAAETERNRVRKELIEKLRSDHAKDLIKQQEKFREQIANDKKARELAQDNLALRSKISTVSTRLANRIFAETDQKNVPEETKALVRQVLNMISQHDGFFRKVTYWDKQQVDNVRQRLTKMISNYGAFNPDTDLDWLVVKTADPRDNDYTARDKVEQDLINIETGLLEYRNAEGKGRISLADRKTALMKVQEALSEIWNVVKARSEMEIAGRKWQVIELAEWMRGEMGNSTRKGNRIGFGTKARNALSGGVTWGNLTPEYFFKNLKNKAMDQLHKGLKDAENRSGLEAGKAKVRLAEIAEKNGFAKWDGQEKHKVQTRSGDIEMTTEQIMALYATWLRESNQMRPVDTAHLLNGGFVLAEEEKNKGKPGWEKTETKPIKMGKDQLSALGGYLTDEQKQYVNDMVAYMSSELAELGNEASMKMYGIKKFTEQYYFPIKSWGGVLNKRSDAGISSNNENRAAQMGASKRVKNNASNAIQIADFTPTAIKHVAEMITYNTVGPAIENMNKVLNQQLQYGEIKYTEDGEVEEDDTYKRNMRAAFQEAYGKQAADYLATFMQDMNGGVGSRYGNTLWDKLLSVFKKSAVAGSLSVAAQQPLSYIRAAMMINPKYLAKALSREMWTGAYKELKNYSGLAVIKEMGKFDMNFGQSMQDWITPEGMVKSKGKAAWEWIQDKSTALPGWMDALTWTRMWVAVKAEQHAMHPEMDVKSDAFLNTAAERFNDLMRQTQVYDSVMVKSQNMRSQNQFAKTITSFMAEPTLSLNVLADAFQNVKEKGGGRKAAKALVLFAISAAAQAAVKAAFSTGRSPDKKKNEWENFLYRLGYNLINEANPIGLIPGYSNLVDALKDGEMTDNALSIVGKAKDIVESLQKMISAGEGYNWYRGIEDIIGQALQLGTNVPAKNMMRDFRALVNLFSGGSAEWLTGGTYAKRPTSSAMLKYQLIDTISKEDLIGLVNTMLGDAGYKTDAKAYYERIYEAEKAGDQQAADQMKEYLTLKSTAEDPAKSINDALRGLAKADDTLSEEERTAYVIDTSTDKGGSNYVISQVKEGKLSGTAARKMLKEIYPDKDDDTIWWQVDRAEYTAETGKQLSSNDKYYRLKDAINGNKSDDIKETVNTLLKHGITKDKIKGKLSDWKSEYLAATGKDKTRLEDALTKAYKAIGLTAAEALKIIHGWKPKKTK